METPKKPQISTEKLGAPVSEWSSKEWANEQLAFAIRVLQGKCGGHRWKGNLQLALLVKDRLLGQGYPWQAARVENWIHRLQPCRADSLNGDEGERLLSCAHGILPIAKSMGLKSAKLKAQNVEIGRGVAWYARHSEDLQERSERFQDRQYSHEETQNPAAVRNENLEGRRRFSDPRSDRLKSDRRPGGPT